MKKETSRSIQAKASKKLLFETAIRLFAEKGIEHVTIEDICRSANLSKGLFYHYFDSKEALMSEHFRIVNEGQVRIRSLFRPGESFSQRLLTFTRNIAQLSSGFILESTRVAYIYALKNPGKSRLAEKGREYYQIIIEIVQYGKGRKEIRSDYSVEECADYIAAVLWGSLFSNLIGFEGVHKLDEMLDLHTSIICAGLSVDKADRC